jgi:hypothetical protein
MCLALSSAGGGGLKLVTVQPCDETGKDIAQLWQSSPDGQIHPQSALDLCWTVSAEPGVEHGGGGDHLNKDLSVELCDPKLAAYQQFHMGRGFVGKPP